MLNDPLFIAKLREKDEYSFNILFVETKELIYNTALHLVQNETEAMDIMQDVYVELFISIAQFKGKSSLTTWIYRICINKSLMALRKQKRAKFFRSLSNFSNSDEPKSNWAHPGVIAIQKENAKLLYAAIAKLKPKEQIAFTLFQIEEIPQKQIAEIMHQSIPATETQIFRAKQKLQKWLINLKE